MLRLPKHKTKAQKVDADCEDCRRRCWCCLLGHYHSHAVSGPAVDRLFLLAFFLLPACPPAFPPRQLERVDAVIKALGLGRCRDTIIGDHMRRGVSGARRATECSQPPAVRSGRGIELPCPPLRLVSAGTRPAGRRRLASRRWRAASFTPPCLTLCLQAASASVCLWDTSCSSTPPSCCWMSPRAAWTAAQVHACPPAASPAAATPRCMLHHACPASRRHSCAPNWSAGPGSRPPTQPAAAPGPSQPAPVCPHANSPRTAPTPPPSRYRSPQDGGAASQAGLQRARRHHHHPPALLQHLPPAGLGAAAEPGGGPGAGQPQAGRLGKLAQLVTARPRNRFPILCTGGVPAEHGSDCVAWVACCAWPPVLQGHPIFYGKGAEAAAWFDRLGFACPYGVNIADWILDLASGEVSGKQK